MPDPESFTGMLWLAVADKLALGFLALVAGLWINARLERYKTRQTLAAELARRRADAANTVWRAITDYEFELRSQAHALAGLFHRELRAASIPGVPEDLPPVIPASLVAIAPFMTGTLPSDALRRVEAEIKPHLEAVYQRAAVVSRELRLASFWLPDELHREFVGRAAALGNAFADLEPTGESWKQFIGRLAELHKQRVTAEQLLARS